MPIRRILPAVASGGLSFDIETGYYPPSDTTKIWGYGALSEPTKISLLHDSVDGLPPIYSAFNSEPSPIISVTNASAAVCGNYIYLIGGIVDATSSRRSEIQRYNLYTKEWELDGELPKSIIALRSETVGDKIYIFGGEDELGSELDDVYEYDTVSGLITAKASMPCARKYFATCVYDGKIYAYGGISGSSDASKMHVYDPAANSWETKADSLADRSHFDMDVIGDKIYTSGGSTYTYKTTLIYDITNNTWTDSGTNSRKVAGNGSVAYNGKLYTMGTYDKTETRVSVYDPAGNSLEMISNFNRGVCGSVVRVGYRAYIVGEDLVTFALDGHVLEVGEAVIDCTIGEKQATLSNTDSERVTVPIRRYACRKYEYQEVAGVDLKHYVDGEWVTFTQQ